MPEKSIIDGGIIQQNDARAEHQDFGDGDTLLLSQTELVDRPFGQVRDAQARERFVPLLGDSCAEASVRCIKEWRSTRETLSRGRARMIVIAVSAQVWAIGRPSGNNHLGKYSPNHRSDPLLKSWMTRYPSPTFSCWGLGAELGDQKKVMEECPTGRNPNPTFPTTPFGGNAISVSVTLLGCKLQTGYRVPACSPNHRLRSLHACQSFGNGFICAMKIEPGKFP